MPTRRKILTIALTAALALTAAAGAQAQAAETRTQSMPLGTVTMPRSVTVAEGEPATLTTDVTLNASVAEEAGATWLLVGVGNDAATDLAVTIESISGGEGFPEPARTEGDGMERAQWWFPVNAFDADQVQFTVTSQATTSEDILDVETLIMGFDADYNVVNGPDGAPLTAQSFTSVDVEQTGDGSSAGNDTDDNNTLGNDTDEDDTLDNGTLGNDTLGDDDEEESIPSAGALLALAAVGAAAVALRRRRG